MVEQKKDKNDVMLGIFLVLLFLSIISSIVLKLLDIINIWLSLLIPFFVLILILIYWISKRTMKKTTVDKKYSKPELEDIVSPLSAWEYVKQYFQQNFGIMLKLSNKKSYLKMKTVGQEGYETKIYSILAQHETRDNIDVYHIVLQGHNPSGLLFLKNESNPQKIAELEQGVAMKSPQYVTETVTQRDDLSGRETTRKVLKPIAEVQQPQAPQKQPEQKKEEVKKDERNQGQ